jgi:hypothetical protein
MDPYRYLANLFFEQVNDQYDSFNPGNVQPTFRILKDILSDKSARYAIISLNVLDQVDDRLLLTLLDDLDADAEMDIWQSLTVDRRMLLLTGDGPISAIWDEFESMGILLFVGQETAIRALEYALYTDDVRTTIHILTNADPRLLNVDNIDVRNCLWNHCHDPDFDNALESYRLRAAWATLRPIFAQSRIKAPPEVQSVVRNNFLACMLVHAFAHNPKLNMEASL